MSTAQQVHILCIFPLLLWFAGCTNLQPAQAPTWTRDGVHFSGGTVLAFNTPGSRLASGGYNGDIAIFEMPSGKQIYKGYHHAAAVRGLAWVEGHMLISAAEDGQLQLWDTRAQRVVRKVTTSPISALVYFPRHKTIITGHSDGRLIAWQYPSLHQRSQQQMHGHINALARTYDEQKLAAATEQGAIAVTDHALTSLHNLQHAPKAIKTLSFHKDGRHLRGGAWFYVYEWDVERNTVQTVATEHMGEVTSVAFSPDGNTMVSLGRWTDSAIRLTDSRSGKVLRRLKAHEWCGAAVRFSPDGRYVVSTSDDESVRLYDLQAPYRPE